MKVRKCLAVLRFGRFGEVRKVWGIPSAAHLVVHSFKMGSEGLGQTFRTGSPGTAAGILNTAKLINNLQ